MAHTIAATVKGDFSSGSSSLASSANLRSVGFSKNIDNIHSILQHFYKPDAELLNPIMRSLFNGIAEGFVKAEQEVHKFNDCHSACLSRLNELAQNVRAFDKLYEMYDKATLLETKRDAVISQIQSIFQHHQNQRRSSGALSKPFQELWPIINSAKHSEFERFVAFQEKMTATANWIQNITENASLFSKPVVLMEAPYASHFLKFTDAVFSGQKEAALAIYPNLPYELQQSIKMDLSQDEDMSQMQSSLKKIIFPMIGQLNDQALFFRLLWKVACDEKVEIENWDRHWAENNWKTQLDTFPHRILLALCCYESRQLNQILKRVWEDLLKETNISAYDQWPICSRLLQTVKNSPHFITFLMKERKQGIFEYSPASFCIQEVVKELTIRASVYNSIYSFQKEIPSCCAIIDPLKTQLQSIGEALITYPQQLTLDQKVKLENATGILLKLPRHVNEEKFSAGDVNCLIELMIAVFLSDFCATPSKEINVSKELIEEIASKMDRSQIKSNIQLYPINSSKGVFFFFPCPIQVAARMVVAAKIGSDFALPISKMVLVNYRPLDIKKELKGIIKQWSTPKDSIDLSQPFETFVKQLEGLPDPFVAQIKDFIGYCITGQVVDNIEHGERYLKQIPALPFDQAKERVQEILAFLSEYSSSSKFESAHRSFYESHLPLTGLLFPYFSNKQNKSETSQQRAKFPTTFKHLWTLFNLITSSYPKSNDSSDLFFYTNENEIFQFFELSNYFSTMPSSFPVEESAATSPIMQLLLEILVAGRVFEKARAHLKFQVGLASEPVKEAQKRLDIIKALVEAALENNAIITPNMLISKIQS